MKKNVYLTLLSIFIIVITASSSYAYFNSKLDIKGSNENNLNVLNIQNGNDRTDVCEYGRRDSGVCDHRSPGRLRTVPPETPEGRYHRSVSCRGWQSDQSCDGPR